MTYIVAYHINIITLINNGKHILDNYRKQLHTPFTSHIILYDSLI